MLTDPNTSTDFDFSKMSLEKLFDVFNLSTLLWQELTELQLKTTFLHHYKVHLATSKASSLFFVEIATQIEAANKLTDEVQQNSESKIIYDKILEFINNNKLFFVETSSVLIKNGHLK